MRKLEAESNLFCPLLAVSHILDQLPSVPRAHIGVFVAHPVIDQDLTALADELPRLNPQFVFQKAVIDQSTPSIDRERFESRLRQFFAKKPKVPPLSSELVEFLFKRAVDAHKHIRAWNIINTKSPELAIAQSYLRQELTRHVLVRLLITIRKQRTPSWMSAWSRCWIEALQEIQEQIEEELRFAMASIDDLCNMRVPTRFEVESYILWLERKEISKRPGVARNLEVILAAFADAAGLVPKSDRNIDKYVALIKQRIARVARSPKKCGEAYSLLLRAMLALEYGKSDPKAHS